MINLNNYILEKLKIHSDIKLKRSHDVFNSKEDTFDFIKTACKDYGFSYEQNNYWLYIFKNKSSKFPNILFGYSDKDENGNILKNDHGLSTLKYNSGSVEDEKIIINTDVSNYELINYPKDYDENPDGDPRPTEYNILFALDTLDTLDKFKK